MQAIYKLFTGMSLLFFLSCHNDNTAQVTQNKETDEFIEEIENLPESSTTAKQLFGIESGYIKFRSDVSGQEMTREWKFDQYGKQQYEENYMIIMGQKSGDKSIVVDGFQYVWNDDANEGTKRHFHQVVTDYDLISEKDIQRYGIEKHGYEEILGRECLKVTIEKPAKTTIWVWKGIALKTESIMGSYKILMQAIEINEGAVEKSAFELPANIAFQEENL